MPEMQTQVSKDEESATVTANCAYDTRLGYAAIIERGADVVMPIRRNGRAWNKDCPASITRNHILRATRHLARALWTRLAEYRLRSRIEAPMDCLKAFEDRMLSRGPDQQTAEIHIHIAIIHRFNAPGTAEIEAVA